MQIVYVDVLFFLNLLVNYLLLLATAKIAAVHTKRLKLFFAALFGAAYAVAAFVPDFGFLLSPVMRLVSGVSMVLIGFSQAKHLLRLCLIFFAVSAGFGGLIFALSLAQGGGQVTEHFILPINFTVLIATFFVAYALFSLIFQRLGRNLAGKMMDVTIMLGGNSVTLNGFVDSGHSLTCPMTQHPVFITTSAHLSPLFSPEVNALLTEQNLLNPIDLLPTLQEKKHNGFYLIPYTAIGQALGFLLCFAPDKVSMDKKEIPGIRIALSPTAVSDGGQYHILIHGGFL